MAFGNCNLAGLARKQAGWGLMEIIAALAVMGLVVAGGLSLWSSATSSEASTSISRDVHALRAATQQLHQGQGTYGTNGTVLNDILVTAKKIPTTIRVDTSTTPDTLTHKANGSVTITSTGTGFTITLTNIDVDVCMPLMTTSSGGWVSIKAGTAAARTTFPITAAQAETDCKTGTTMVFAAN